MLGAHEDLRFWMALHDVATIWLRLALGRPFSDLFRGIHRGIQSYKFDEIAGVDGIAAVEGGQGGGAAAGEAGGEVEGVYGHAAASGGAEGDADNARRRCRQLSYASSALAGC